MKILTIFVFFVFVSCCIVGLSCIIIKIWIDVPFKNAVLGRIFVTCLVVGLASSIPLSILGPSYWDE